ncbi:MAG: UDP-N-acetylmuramate--L-alanine ligase [Kiritimatiellia bacterium]
MIKNNTGGLNDLTACLTRPGGNVHLAGICGVGMAGLAFLLKSRGFSVSGCDISRGALAAWLEEGGISVLRGHSPDHITPEIEWVVRTPAVSSNSPEIKRARELRIPVFTRGMVLPHLLAGRKSVAVAGTHGKTTTAFFLTQLLITSRLDPSWCIGGRLNGKPAGPAGHGNGEHVVVEADESDGTLALYKPDIGVITAIEFDHMEHFGGKEDFYRCFREFCRNTAEAVVFCADDPGAAAVCAAEREKTGSRGGAGGRRFVSYGFSEGPDIRGAELHCGGKSVEFALERGDEPLGRISLPLTGRHNALNALSACAAGLTLGLDFESIKRGLGSAVLPCRRYEKIIDSRDLVVISDYAHHPSEIKALVETSAGPDGRLLAVFQPHRYTRTSALRADFPRSFTGVDELVLVPVYAASEEPVPGGTVWDLYSEFGTPAGSAGGKSAVPKISVSQSLENAWAYLRRNIGKGDTLLIVGAGDVEKIAEWARKGYQRTDDGGQRTDYGERKEIEELQFELQDSEVRFDEPLAEKTGLQVGGSADAWADVESLSDLKIILEFAAAAELAVNVLGGGRNILVSDLGLRGVTIRLSDKPFSGIRFENEEKSRRAGRQSQSIVAGAGARLAQLISWCAGKGLSGLEFLSGVPGSLGGALCMNAGTGAGELCRHVKWIRCLNMDGTECIVKGGSLGSSYRTCAALEKRIAVEACVEVNKGNAGDVQKRVRAEIERRRWMAGLRSAGSVFMNPDGRTAGELIDKAGMKGRRVGGAEVLKEHGNIIVTKPGATASDVRALMEIVRTEVERKSGIRLQAEIVLIGW